MVNISREMYGRNGLETKAHSYWLFCLNEKHIEKRLYHKNFRVTTGIYLSDRKKHEPVDEPKQTTQHNFYRKRLTNKVTIDYRTTAIHRFWAKLEFKQNDVI